MVRFDVLVSCNLTAFLTQTMEILIPQHYTNREHFLTTLLDSFRVLQSLTIMTSLLNVSYEMSNIQAARFSTNTQILSSALSLLNVLV